MARSLITVIGAFACVAFVVVVGTLLATVAFPSQGGEISSAYLAANLAVSFAAAIIGGAIAARFAPRRPLIHAGAVAALMVLLSLAGGTGSAPGQPEWYPVGVLLLGLAGVAVGALWVGSRTHREPAG